MAKYKTRNISLIHALVLAAFVLFNNCSGFTASEIQQIQVSSSTSADGSMPTPVVPPAATPVRVGSTKVFMASGHMGRTVMSCDDGKTWINDRSDDDSARCNIAGDPNFVECTHNGRAAITLDSGDGYFFADYGWGYAGSVRKSRDGINWSIIKTGSWGGGVMYAAHQLWLLWDGWYLSSDLGQTWSGVTASPVAIVNDHPRGYRFGTKFIGISRDNGLAVSYDQGQTWEVPTGFNSVWANMGAAEGNGMIVTVGYSFDPATGKIALFSARSIDDGHSWSGQTVDPATQLGTWETLLFNGKEFVAFSAFTMFKSTDGINWSSTPTKYSADVNRNNAFGKISFNPVTGTYVMISNASYSNQMAARSPDGVNWTFLDSGRFPGGHPINVLIVGDMDAQYCP